MICDEHSLPHKKSMCSDTHCRLIFEASLFVEEIQERLVPSNGQTTLNIYIHVIKKQKDVVSTKLSNYVNF